MIHDNGSSNPSGNRLFEDILEVRISRRKALARGAALSATGFLAALAGNKLFVQGSEVTAAQGTGGTLSPGSNPAIAQDQSSSLINFSSLPATDSAGPMPSISSDYQFDVLIPWG
ncbi:MAG: PhoX family phosphatase, partial [Leptolyngbyaceae bacterium]|nr:PhoX family phosphatase [Leptolyngbyaceae bacterium]